MKFVDEVTIEIRSGNGGRGCVSFRREKYIPRGGPDGGNGGKGGDVTLEARSGLQSLLDLSYPRIFKANDGRAGQGKAKNGKNGSDLIIPVPLGTLIKNNDADQLLADLTSDREQFVAARGGRGGRGNKSFATSVNRAPRIAGEAGEGERKVLKLELKLLAQVGIVGFPNAGKSTLISKLSAARPKISDYPFTTIVPNLGIIELENDRRIVAADIPGLIRGAHQGIGLGDRFLRHIDRTGLVLHLLDISRPEIDPIKNYHDLNEELRLFNPKLPPKPQVVVVNKLDLPSARLRFPEVKRSFDSLNLTIYPISAITGDGMDALLDEIERRVFAGVVEDGD